MYRRQGLLKDIRLQAIGDHRWMFEYRRLKDAEYDEFHEALELRESGLDRPALKTLRSLNRRFPEFIDARYHLALMLEERGNSFEAILERKKAVDIGLACLPNDFFFDRDLIEWTVLENRPFLRALHAHGLDLLKKPNPAEALVIFLNLLDLDPGDHIGVRALTVNIYFTLRRPGDVLRICERYGEGDMVEHLVFGRPLALYQLGRIGEAKVALRAAIGVYPFIASELLKRRSHAPARLDPGRITLGGLDQAYYYRRESWRFWTQTPGMLELLRNCFEQAKC
jgi:tetratricopeptide (TPR) repeat protein